MAAAVFPGTRGRLWQVSSGGGIEPRWSPDGRELYYLDNTAHLISVALGGSRTGLDVGESRRVFDASSFVIDPFHTSYEVAPDGAFLFSRQRQQDRAAGAVQVVEADHWFADVRRKTAR